MQHFNLWLRRPALCLFWLTLNFFTPPAQAQEYLVSVQHYSVPEGLSHRYVRHVVQDGRGFIWAATFDGLNRFDGFEFRQYTKEKDGLSSNSCEYLLEDCRGQIWVVYSRNPGGEGGSAGFYPIDLLDPVTGAIKPFEKAFQVPFQTKDIRGIRADGSGNIYILVKSGQSHEVFRYDGQSLRGLLQAPLDTVGYLALSGGATVNLLDGNRLLQYDSLGGLRHQVALPAHCDFIRVAEGHSWVGRKRPESGPALWPVRDGKVGEPFYFLGRSGQPLNLEWSDDFEIPVYPGGSGRWWVFDNERLLLFGPQGQFVYDFSANLEEHSLSYPAFITFDRRNTAWIGSTQGLLSVSIRKNPFSNYLTSRELKDTRGIAQGKEGQVYFVQNGQAWMLSADANAAVNTGAPAWLAAARDAAGNLWFGDYYFNVHFYDPVSGAQKVIRPSEVAGDARFNSTRALFPDPASGRIWIGTGKGGLAYIDSPEEGIQPFAAYNQFQHLQKAGIWCFLPDGSALWLGTNQGLYRLEREKGITAEYSRRTGSLPFDEIYHIYKDKEGLFWLATKGGGLVRWDRSRGTYRQFTQEEGLSHNVIYAVYEDENEQLWLPSNHGLMRFDKHSFQVNTYLPRDGLPHEEFNFSSHFQAPDGRLYFGGLKGVTAFYPEALYQETDQAGPGLVVSQYLELDGATGAFVDRTTELLAAGRIRLAPKNKSFILKIAFPDYQSPQDNRFAYRVEGLQDSWVYQPDNDIRLNSLPYGSFTLHVKAQGASGRWSARELTLPMTVLRPFYLRWWFIGLCVTLFFLAIAGRMRSLRRRARKLETEVKKRTRQIEEDKEVIEKQAAELRELDEMKSRFFTNVAHELRTPITLIQGPLQLALEKATLDKDTAAMLKLARGNTKNLLRLVEELLDLKKMDAGKLKLEEQSVEFYPLLRRLAATFESAAQANGIGLSLQYPEGQALFLELDAVKFERIMLNLLSNAIKFTPGGGRVQVTVEDLGARMRIAVSDTGYGIHPDELTYVFDRYYQARVNVSSGPPQSPRGGKAPLEGLQEQPSSANPPPSGGQEGGGASGGAGIGLSLSREYAQLMGGTLTATSEVGKGSIFTFEFPKKEVPGAFVQEEKEEGAKPNNVLTMQISSKPIEDTSHLWAAAAASPPPFEGGGGRLLLAEDNSDMRRYLREILRPHYDILTAANGRIALDLLSNLANEKEAPALVITDIMMPEMDGFELIRRLKSSPQWQGLPVIALTARAGLDDRLSALRYGVDDYLAKPFEPAELLARVANLLQNYQRRKEWLEAQKAEAEERAYFLKIDPPQAIPSSEQQWLAELEALALDKVGGAEFSVTDLAHLLHLSERQLRRKLKDLTGLSPAEYLNEIRLQRARQLLESRTYETVAEVSYAIGLSTPKHFSRLFKARFGKVPSSYF